MEDEFVIRRDGTCLTLSRTGYFLDSGMPYFQYDCRLDAPGLSAQVAIVDMLPSEIAILFNDMDARWRGWEGTLKARALEDQMRMEATRDSLGHVFLKTILCSGFDGFRAEATMALDLGDLSMLAANANRFFSA